MTIRITLSRKGVEFQADIDYDDHSPDYMPDILDIRPINLRTGKVTAGDPYLSSEEYREVRRRLVRALEMSAPLDR